MAKIEIYARMRPSASRYDGIVVNKQADSDNILIHTKELQQRTSTPTRSNKGQPPAHHFQFKKVFTESATQEEVFDSVSKKIIDSFLDGYNGTIFAYGQTSSGKTHTIEGSGRKFADRGIIPRTLSYVYKEVERRTSTGEDVTVHISYMEIYQDTGYDLLNPGMRPGALMVTLPKIQISEGPGGHIMIRNLSSHLAACEEVAQSLLFQGSTCRKVAETSMNQCSSRSHSVFSISLTVKTANSEVITKSKLNLVDLAGSERVAKTGADGRILQEAKHINLSLHHLEHVIVNLQHQHKTTLPASPKSSQGRTKGPSTPKSRQSSNSPLHSRPTTRGGHIPYRNCMLTMVLKDSLGGNCLTAMIATVSVEAGNLGETISTLRFSQRVACISNKARKNEELDDKAVIKKLKQKVLELENEVSLMKDRVIQQEDSGVDVSSDPTAIHSLTDQDKLLCHQILHNFFHGKIDNPVAAGINTGAKFHECLKVLKMVVLQTLGISKKSSSDADQARELASKIKQPSQASVTTSPNSQLSSGFGSLVDTEGSCESSANQSSLGKRYTETQAPPSLPHSTNPSRNVTASVAPTTKSVHDQLKEQRLIKRQSHHQPTANSPPQKIITPKLSEKSPRQVTRAWMSPPNRQSPWSPPSTQSSMGSKPLSPRKGRDIQQLIVQQEELVQSKQERNKLANVVQLLDFHVEEEKLKNELFKIGEQLAEQHVLVTRLEKADSNWEKLCAEKIAQQQLRIKQAKVHQRLVDLQYQIEISNRQKAPLVSSCTSPPTTKSSSKVQKELTKQEVQQAQVQNQIDTLKISQAEKQLELKEAATRRKILALKQQLLASHNARQSKERQPQTAPVLIAEPKQTNLVPETTKVYRALANQTPNTHQSLDSTRNFMEHVQSTHSSPQTAYSHQHTKSPVVNSPKIEQPSKPNSAKKALPKLALPEEVKETEYMTAIQRQKARVSRIRRCIVAATVIQRAWRHYKQK